MSPAASPRRGREPVVITGVGAVSPLGSEFGEIATGLLAGRSGIRHIETLGPHGARQVAAPVTGIPYPGAGCGLAAEEFASLDRLERLQLAPLAAALADSGLRGAAVPRDRMPRIGLVLGLGAEHLKRWEDDFLAGGTSVFKPTRDRTIVHALARLLRLDGPAVTVAAACASSGYALAMARTWIDAGWVNACLAGGCDMLSPTSIAAFYNLRALSRCSEDPARASRPFDRARDGFVMGEGGAFFVLERRSAAVARGARVRCELAGVGMSRAGAHMVIPSTDPTHAARALAKSLEDAGVAPEELDYINAHAAGTPVGDVAEAAAIRLALGAAADSVPVSSTKSMSGHLVSGAAAFELLACLAAVERQAVPPTVNLDEPDDRCRLDHVPHVHRPRRVRVAASNSFGFGGSNLCLVVRAAA
ncbi:MAG: beta-ketoacyl-[acyl-carrier-protein] synthase family protein [Planctomycetia bacterium]